MKDVSVITIKRLHILNCIRKFQMVDLTKAFKQALKGFSLWWLPLCGLSFIILVNQKWVPRYLGTVFNQEQVLGPVSQIMDEYHKNASSHPVAAVETFQREIQNLITDPAFLQSAMELVHKWCIALVYFILTLLPLYMAVIIVAKSAVRDKEKQTMKKEFKSIFKSSASLLVQMVVKSFCIFFFIPGIYIYIRLMFSGLILAEEKCGPFEAMIQSWRISRGEFKPLFILLMVQIVTLVFETITIIGFIPGEPFKYTLRGAVYWQLKQKEVIDG